MTVTPEEGRCTILVREKGGLKSPEGPYQRGAHHHDDKKSGHYLVPAGRADAEGAHAVVAAPVFTDGAGGGGRNIRMLIAVRMCHTS